MSFHCVCSRPRSAAITPGAPFLHERNRLARVARRSGSRKISIRPINNKTVNTLVRARKRQVRAAIWSPILRDSGTGGKAGSRLLTPIRTLRRLSRKGVERSGFTEQSHARATVPTLLWGFELGPVFPQPVTEVGDWLAGHAIGGLPPQACPFSEFVWR